MTKSYPAQWLAAILATLLVILPVATAAPQNPQQTAAPAPQTPPTTQAPTAPQTQGDQEKQKPTEQPVPQTENPNVKPGSKADVNAIGDRGVGKGLDFYSLEREIALGKQLAQEVDKSAKFINDPVVTEYVNRVGQNLVRNSDARVPFTIKVVDSDVVNAFALPGGFFYVNSGLILHADEESELARSKPPRARS
jgi:beta-barrel assembly-enhancing protease